jgi:hypothetical protein
MSPESISDAVLNDVSDRVGRIATAEMLLLASRSRYAEAERRHLAIAGANAVFVVLDAVCDRFDPIDVDAFIERLRTDVARNEEMEA